VQAATDPLEQSESGADYEPEQRPHDRRRDAQLEDGEPRGARVRHEADNEAADAADRRAGDRTDRDASDDELARLHATNGTPTALAA
jgi:hypothetical protein